METPICWPTPETSLHLESLESGEDHVAAPLGAPELQPARATRSWDIFLGEARDLPAKMVRQWDFVGFWGI